MAKELMFPTKPTRSPGRIEKDFVRVAYTLAQDPLYHFSVGVTRAWKPVEIAISPPDESTPLASIGLFRRTRAPEADIEVLATTIPREVDPADWLEVYLQGNGHTLVKGRRIPSAYGEVGDLLTSTDVEGRTYVSRSLSIKDDARIYTVQCRVAQEGYAAVAEEFLVALQTFGLMKPTNKLYAEPMHTHEISAPVAARFLFPDSWQLKEDKQPVPAGTAFSLLNLLSDACVGQFTFAAIPARLEKDHRGLAENYLGQLRDNGIEIPDQKLEPREHAKVFQGLWGNVLSARKGDTPMEVRCCVLQHKLAWFLFGMAGASREVASDIQMINARAYRLSLETFAVAEDAGQT